jgi:CHAD domain-containing protein
MPEELERARKAVRDLNKTLKGLSRDTSPEEVHKLRTTTRKVEAIVAVLTQLEGKESRRLLKSIEPIRKASGGVRDMDVLAGDARKLARRVPGDGLTRLVEQLRAAREQNADELRHVLGRRRTAARENLKAYAGLIRAAEARVKKAASANGLPTHAHDGIHNAAAEVVRALSEWPELNTENIHEFRLKVKELRYILQLSADANAGLEEALGDVQRRIGGWHDWHQLHEIATEILTPERDIELLEFIEESTKRRFDRALAAANRLRRKYLSMPIAREA